MSDPLYSPTRSRVTDGTTTTDSPCSLRRIACQTSGILVWSWTNRWERSSGVSSASVRGPVVLVTTWSSPRRAHAR
jgi:hypothetical protein